MQRIRWAIDDFTDWIGDGWYRVTDFVIGILYPSQRVLDNLKVTGASLLLLFSVYGTYVVYNSPGAQADPVVRLLGTLLFVITTLGAVLIVLWYGKKAERHRALGLS